MYIFSEWRRRSVDAVLANSLVFACLFCNFLPALIRCPSIAAMVQLFSIRFWGLLVYISQCSVLARQGDPPSSWITRRHTAFQDSTRGQLVPREPDMGGRPVYTLVPRGLGSETEMRRGKDNPLAFASQVRQFSFGQQPSNADSAGSTEPSRLRRNGAFSKRPALAKMRGFGRRKSVAASFVRISETPFPLPQTILSPAVARTMPTLTAPGAP